MSLNCMKCQNLQRIDSEKELNEHYDHDKPHFGLLRTKVERSWSGNLVPRPYEKMRNETGLRVVKRFKNGPPRIHTSSGPVEYEPGTPRLVRSCGMRRDWSFENLRQIRDENILQEARGY